MPVIASYNLLCLFFFGPPMSQVCGLLLVFIDRQLAMGLPEVVFERLRRKQISTDYTKDKALVISLYVQSV